MARKTKSGWFSRGENCWLFIAVILGFSNLLLILLLWNVSGSVSKTDTLAVSLTVLEIFLAVIAVSGFFLIRGAAMGKAEEEASSVAERVAKLEVQDITPTIVRRAVAEYMSHMDEQSGISDTTDGINAMMQALDDGGTDD
ncbi:hypothetical protein [Algirhabdus cladophorae]|uniref:hypothetical protein n=1 Tax=Algirhabdus cladophorae TaxID=3377108 RepID=UPI003B84A1C1